MSDDKVYVFYNNKNYKIITIFVPNQLVFNIDDFIDSRLKYDDHCKGLTRDDISFSIGEADDYRRALNDYEGGGEVIIDQNTKQHYFIGVSKDTIVFDTVEQAYEFHLEYNTKSLSSIYNIKYFNNTEILIDDELYEEEIKNNNNYFDSRNFQDLIQDIKVNGMYFPFFGYEEDNKFIVIEGLHRAKAIQEIPGQYLCISKKDNTEFNMGSLEAIDWIFCYEYKGENTFLRRKIDRMDIPAFLYISNNIMLSNEIFLLDSRFPSFSLINHEFPLDRFLSLDFIRNNKVYYSKNKSDIQDLYNRYLDNQKLFEMLWININDLNIENLENKGEESILNDPFLNIELDKLKEELLIYGMMYPFIVYKKNDVYYVAEGYHRYQALTNTSCEVACFVFDFDKIYHRYPSYAEDFVKTVFIPKDIFPYQEYPYVPNLFGFKILEENNLWYKIEVTNDIQLIQAYKLIPMVIKHMVNYLKYRHNEEITIFNHMRLINV